MITITDTREVWEGGVLGLLLSGVESASQSDDDIDILRRASTFYSARSVVQRPYQRYPPILKLPVANARKRLHVPVSELDPRYLKLLDASDSCDLKKESGTVHQPLSEHIDAIGKIRNDRGLSFSIAKERERGVLGSRFVDSQREASAPQKPSRTRTILQACPLEGSKSTGDVRPPTGVLVRLYGMENNGDTGAYAPAVLVGRPAWRKALEDVRMPKFGEYNVSIAEMLSQSAAPMSSEKELRLKDIKAADIVDSVFDASKFNNLRDFAKFISCDHINPDVWEAATKKISESVSMSKNINNTDLPVDGVNADPAWKTLNGIPLNPLDGLLLLDASSGKTSDTPETSEKPTTSGGGDAPPAGCDLDVLPDRPMDSWIRDPSPEAPGEAPESHDKGANKQHGIRTQFWDEYRSAISTVSKGSDVLVGISQGHMRLAGPIMTVAKEGDLPTYDHVRAVEPRGACRTFLAKALQEVSASNERELEEVLSIAEEDLFRIVGTNRAWNELISKGKPRHMGRSRIRHKNSMSSFDPLEYRDDVLELGIEDVFHYREKRSDNPVADDSESFLQEPDAPSKLLQEMAYLLGVSPPLDATEERTILDELEYHLPGGEGEQARILRKRIEDVKRRRNELMAKAGVGGKAYEAVEKRLIDRLRKDSIVKIIAETVGYIAALLSHAVGDRIAESPSGALRACLELPVHAKKAIGAAKAIRRGPPKRGEKEKESIDLLTLLACAGSTVIGTRCPPDAPPPLEASSPEIAKRIMAIKATIGDDEAAPRKRHNTRKAAVDNIHFRPLPEVHKNNTRSIVALWSHVRSSQVSVDGVMINPVSACCSYDSEESKGVWASIQQIGTDKDDEIVGRGAVSGIQPAKDLPIVVNHDNPNKKIESPVFIPIRCPDTMLVEPDATNVTERENQEDNIEKVLNDLLSVDPTLSSELVPPSGGLVGLSQETIMRLDNLIGKEDSDVRSILLNTGSPEEPESVRILSAFLKSELAPALRKMSSSEITALLSADADIAKCSSDLREPETRARFASLADACSVASESDSALILSSVATFVLWAISTSGKDLPQKSTEAAKHAADILIKRLDGRLEFSRSDRKDEDTSKVKAVKEALRAANRAALDKLSDADRELLGELKMAIRGHDTPEAIAASDASDASAEREVEEAIEDVEEARRSDKEIVEDASDAFF